MARPADSQSGGQVHAQARMGLEGAYREVPTLILFASEEFSEDFYRQPTPMQILFLI